MNTPVLVYLAGPYSAPSRAGVEAKRRRPGPSVCHPERPARSLGLCAQCYKKHWRSKNADRERSYRLKRREKHPGCEYAVAKAWREKNRSRWYETARAAYHRNPEPTKRRTAEWERDNAERARELARQRYARNPSRQSEAAKRWLAKAPGYGKLTYNRRRARLLDGKSPGVSRAEWQSILEWFGGRCAYCQRVAEQIDHLEPLARGGLDAAHNVVPACAHCNASKGAKSLIAWLLIGGGQ